ncbi:MAG TPA: hypothetical protein VF256_18500, partial [Streptosporangiaceae bacterium]
MRVTTANPVAGAAQRAAVVGGSVTGPPLGSRLHRCARLPPMREQFWFWYGYRPGIRTVARQTLR